MKDVCDYCGKHATKYISGGFGLMCVCEEHYTFFLELPNHYEVSE